MTTLREALAPSLDAYFHGLPKVAFSRCELGYLADVERDRVVEAGFVEGGFVGSQGGLGPQRAFRYTGRWHDWV